MLHGLISLLILLCLAANCFAPEPKKAKIAQAGWLAGTWQLDESGRTITEHWMSPAGGTMLGMSRTIAGSRTVEHEFILLREDNDGGLSYVAKPSRQPEAAFKLTNATASELVFENTAHDFPQRILYTLKNATNLVAAIEGTKNGKSRRLEFNYIRTKPPS